MARNTHHPNDLRSEGADAGEALAPAPFTLTPLGPDPSLGWSGWGSGAMAGWAAAQAERMRGGGEGEQDRTRSEPRDQ